MKVSFTAAEYNPFHNGHKYHLEQTRKHGVDAVICVMSGNFVQRGDIAVCEKHIRAKTALLSGADLVLELPMKYAVSNAELFAEGFVSSAALTGLNGVFSFGAACSERQLREISLALSQEEALSFCKVCCKESGVSYPVAAQKFLREKYGDDIKVPRDGNDILAIEYLKAIKKYCPDSETLLIGRKNVYHDERKAVGEYTSAGALRSRIYNECGGQGKPYGLYSAARFIPENVLSCFLEALSAGRFPADRRFFSAAALSRLYLLTPEKIRDMNNVSHGIENRIFSALSCCASLDEVCVKIKCKRYTMSRIRQILMSCILGITRDDIASGVRYIRVLGFNPKGRQVLHKMKSTASIPVITNLSQLDKSDLSDMREAWLDYAAGRLFNLCLPEPREGNPEYDIAPVVI